MSDFDDDFAAAGSPQLMEVLGDAGIVYRERDKADVTLTARVGSIHTKDEVNEQGGRKRIYERQIVVTVDGAGVAAISQEAEFVIDGVTWAIDSIDATGPTEARVRLIRTAVVDMTRRGYRME